MNDYITIKITKERARELRLLICKCGHQKNQHHNLSGTSCLECECNKLREEIMIEPKLATYKDS